MQNFGTNFWFDHDYYDYNEYNGYNRFNIHNENSTKIDFGIFWSDVRSCSQ